MNRRIQYTKPRYDVQRISDDMAAKGWMKIDLARECGVVPRTISSFFRGEFQTPKTAAKISKALGHRPGYYLIREEAVA